jgi:hypothetical protein
MLRMDMNLLVWVSGPNIFSYYYGLSSKVNESVSSLSNNSWNVEWEVIGMGWMFRVDGIENGVVRRSKV